MNEDQRRALDEAREDLEAWAEKHVATLEYLDTTYGIDSHKKLFRRSVRDIVHGLLGWFDSESLPVFALEIMRQRVGKQRNRKLLEATRTREATE